MWIFRSRQFAALQRRTVSESRPTRIGVIADYKPDYRPHAAIAEALEHSAAELGKPVEVIWFDTPRLTTLEGINGLLMCDGIWGGPGSPFKSLDGALEGIRTAREEQIPFLGTCAGFQHTAIEYARNVLGIADANSEEYDPETKSKLFVSRLACSLAGKRLDIQLNPGSLAHLSYGTCNVTEEY